VRWSCTLLCIDNVTVGEKQRGGQRGIVRVVVNLNLLTVMFMHNGTRIPLVAVATNPSLHYCMTALRVLQHHFVPMPWSSGSGNKCTLKICKRAPQSPMQLLMGMAGDGHAQLHLCSSPAKRGACSENGHHSQGETAESEWSLPELDLRTRTL